MDSNYSVPFIPYNQLPFRYANNVKVVCFQKVNVVACSQNLVDFLNNPDVNLLITEYGHSLLDVLTNEGLITMGKENTFQLNRIFSGDPHADATKLMGSISESLIVQECNNNKEVNRELGMIARGGQRISSLMDNYIAVSTGSQQTKINYNHFYNPSDTQRDIIWVDKRSTELQLNSIVAGSLGPSVKPAGLQIKTSHNYQYVLSSIKQYHYPVIYFDLSNDWHLACDGVTQMNYQKGYFDGVAILVPPSEMLLYLKERIKNYFSIIKGLINGEITIQDLIDEANYTGDKILGGVLESSAIDSGSTIII